MAALMKDQVRYLALIVLDELDFHLANGEEELTFRLGVEGQSALAGSLRDEFTLLDRNDQG